MQVIEIRFHDEAVAELDAAMGWYHSQEPGLGISLHHEVNLVLDRIRSDPETGLACSLAGCRYLMTPRFPYTVNWTVLEEVIWILAIAHIRRRPGYWKRRRPG